MQSQSPMRFSGVPVPGIDPVAGWSLLTFPEWDDYGFNAPTYFARSAGRDILLHVSRFNFTPSQDRFDFLVRHGFPGHRGPGPWTDADLDALIFGEALARNAA